MVRIINTYRQNRLHALCGVFVFFVGMKPQCENSAKQGNTIHGNPGRDTLQPLTQTIENKWFL